MPRMVNTRTRYLILRRDEYKCYYCGATSETAQLHLDHVIPYSKGGTTDPTNLITACQTCNIGKSTLSAGNVEEILNEIKRRNIAYNLEDKLKKKKPHEVKKKQKVYKLNKVSDVKTLPEAVKYLSGEVVTLKQNLESKESQLNQAAHQLSTYQKKLQANTKALEVKSELVEKKNREVNTLNDHLTESQKMFIATSKITDQTQALLHETSEKYFKKIDEVNHYKSRNKVLRSEKETLEMRVRDLEMQLALDPNQDISLRERWRLFFSRTPVVSS